MELKLATQTTISCLSVYVSLYLHVCVWLCVFGMCVHGQTRGHPWVLSLWYHPPGFSTKVSQGLNSPSRLGWQASDSQPSACFHHPSTGITNINPTSIFFKTRMLRIELGSSSLVASHFIDCSISPVPRQQFLKSNILTLYDPKIYSYFDACMLRSGNRRLLKVSVFCN